MQIVSFGDYLHEMSKTIFSPLVTICMKCHRLSSLLWRQSAWNVKIYLLSFGDNLDEMTKTYFLWKTRCVISIPPTSRNQNEMNGRTYVLTCKIYPFFPTNTLKRVHVYNKKNIIRLFSAEFIYPYNNRGKERNQTKIISLFFRSKT